jgi:BirA family biotin operon repressor/biotin-[acetyl-CoA-carboxylase] ligase
VPLGSGICLSVGWYFADMPAEITALTLAIGVVARRVVKRVTGVTIELKWPNDLVWADRKLGGVLVELAAEAQGGAHVVAGIGLNVATPPDLLMSLSDWPRGAVDLATALGRQPPRLPLVVALVDELAGLFADYPATGFAAYRSDWRAGDYLRGRAVRVDEASGHVDGTALGIEADGALVLETNGGRRRVVAGDVTVRKRA